MIMGNGRTTAMTLAATLTFALFISCAGEAQAQGWNAQYNPNSNYWLPNVEQGSTYPSYTPPPEGQPPPIGDGYAPDGINPGMMGWGVTTPASHVNMPVIPPGQDGKAMATSYLGGYLQPPTKFDATDMGTLPGPQDFGPPPAAVTNINPGGGMPGDLAPQQRWGGQTSRDLGRSPTTVYGAGSQLCDFGQKLQTKPDLKMMPQASEDGPRNANYPGQRGSSNKASNLAGSQSTTDLNGNRSLFSNVRARLTIAPY